jgi:hypothetical protein
VGCGQLFAPFLAGRWLSVGWRAERLHAGRACMTVYDLPDERAVNPSMVSLPVLLVERFIDIDEPDADTAPGCSREIICAIDARQSSAKLRAINQVM